MASEPFGNDGMDDFLSKAEGIYGGEGPDSLVTSTDAAVAMYGGTGDDQLIMLFPNANPTAGTLYGGADNDLIAGRATSVDRLFGGEGDDYVLDDYDDSLGLPLGWLYGGLGATRSWGEGVTIICSAATATNRGRISWRILHHWLARRPLRRHGERRLRRRQRRRPDRRRYRPGHADRRVRQRHVRGRGRT